MSTAMMEFDLSGWSVGDKFAFIGAFAQSVDEFVGIVTEAQIVISDPDWPDKRVASHKIVDYSFDAIQNFIAEPSTVQHIVDAMPENATPEEAMGILGRFLPGTGTVKDALLWLVQNFDDFLKIVLPWILPLILGTEKLGPLRSLLRIPKLRAA